MSDKEEEWKYEMFCKIFVSLHDKRFYMLATRQDYCLNTAFQTWPIIRIICRGF